MEITPELIRQYRERTGASMMEAKKYYRELAKAQMKAEMVELIESGSLDDIKKVVAILVEHF